MSEIREITDLEVWDRFVESSPQGTIFSTSKWLRLFDAPYHIWGYYNGDNLMGGAANFDVPQPLTPFQGILVAPIQGKYTTIMSLYNKIAKSLMKVLPDEFWNHYNYPDIRPFLWTGWRAYIRYTYVLTPDWDILEKDVRNEIKRGMPVSKSNDIEAFNNLYAETFSRKGLPRTASSELIDWVYALPDTELYLTLDYSAGAMLIKDSKRWYYILGASEGKGSASVVWHAVKDKNEVDMVGGNTENIAAFKRNFGGELKPYYGVKRI